MSIPNISEAEWAVMEVLWEKSPQTASAVATALHPSTGWAPNTVRTLITRLVEKGALGITDPTAQPRGYQPAIQRELCIQSESQSFLDRIFCGASKQLLVHFASSANLSKEDVRELKELLDQSTVPSSRSKTQTSGNS